MAHERTGLLILKRALEAPTRQIAENSAVDGGVVVDKMKNGSGKALMQRVALLPVVSLPPPLRPVSSASCQHPVMLH